MLTDIPMYPQFMADCYLFDPDFLKCLAAASFSAIIWVSIHAFSGYIAIPLGPIVFIVQCILRVSTISLDLTVGKDVRMDTTFVIFENPFQTVIRLASWHSIPNLNCPRLPTLFFIGEYVYDTPIPHQSPITISNILRSQFVSHFP